MPLENIRHRAPARRRVWVLLTSCLVAFLMSGFLLEAYDPDWSPLKWIKGTSPKPPPL